MGIVQWLFRVRPLHLAFLVLAALSFVLYVAYVSSAPQTSTAPPTAYFEAVVAAQGQGQGQGQGGGLAMLRHSKDNRLGEGGDGREEAIPIVTGTNQSVAGAHRRPPHANHTYSYQHPSIIDNNNNNNILQPSGTGLGSAAPLFNSSNSHSHSHSGVAAEAVTRGGPGPPGNASAAASPSEEPPRPLLLNAQPQTNIQVVQQRPALTEDGRPDLTMGVAAEYIYEGGHADAAGPHICPEQGAHLRLLIAITSAPAHEAARLAIRQTWGHYGSRRDVSIAFMLGAVANATLLARVRAEELLYADVIRGRFLDTYDNLTLKTISMLEWVDAHCARAAFLLKTDDDMFINVPRLLEYAGRHPAAGQRAIYGRLAKKWKPIRNRKSKYYISPQQYRPAVFPDFTTGPAYLLPARLARELYTAALNHTYFKLEDVFVTGIVASNLHIRRVHVPEFLNKRVSLTPCAVQRGITIHMVQGAEQYDLWKKLLDGVAKCK